MVHSRLRRSGGRCETARTGLPVGVYRRGKSGLHRARCRLTAGRGNSTESATEMTQPQQQEKRKRKRRKQRSRYFFLSPFSFFLPAATVKWCIKSAPAAWRHAGLVNPIGSKVRQRGLTRPADPSGGPLKQSGNRLRREMTTQRQNPAYRPPEPVAGERGK